MSEILIKKESLPERCETCHQADELDANTNYCQRCSGQQKTNLRLVEQEVKPLLTLEAVKNKLLENSYEIQSEDMTRKAQIEQVEKDKHEETLEKQRQQIRDWRIKNRKEYREVMDLAFAYLNAEFSPQAFVKLSFEEKLVWSHMMKDGPKNHEDAARFGVALFLIASIFSFIMSLSAHNLVDGLQMQLLICFMAIIAISFVPFLTGHWRYFNPWRDRRVFRFYRLYKQWNRKVDGQEVPFDPTIDYIEGSPDSPDLVKAFRCKKYPI